MLKKKSRREKDIRIQRPFSQRNTVRKDQEGTGEETGGTETGNGSTDDEGHRVLRDTADQAADFEDEDRCEVDPFDAQECVELSK